MYVDLIPIYWVEGGFRRLEDGSWEVYWRMSTYGKGMGWDDRMELF